jgi:hypothetical protein
MDIKTTYALKLLFNPGDLEKRFPCTMAPCQADDNWLCECPLGLRKATSSLERRRQFISETLFHVKHDDKLRKKKTYITVYTYRGVRHIIIGNVYISISKKWMWELKEKYWGIGFVSIVYWR